MIKFCSLFSGSSGNCIYLSAGDTKILIDAGGSAKRVSEALSLISVTPEEIDAVLISHEHVDHTGGIGILSERHGIPVYANEGTWDAMAAQSERIRPANRMYFNTGEEFCIGDICILPFSIPHDAADPVGFNIYAENKKISTATDIGHVSKNLLEHIDGSDLLLIEANHDIEMLRCGPYPWALKRRIMGDNGHLSNDAAAEVVVHMARRGTERFILGHLSKENNFPELAYQTVCNFLRQNDICVDTDITLEVARRNMMSTVVAM